MKFLLVAPVLALASDIFNDDEPTCIATEWEHGIVYKMGANYDIGHVDSSSPADCCTKCAAVKGCKAWTTGSDGGACWLHKGAGNRKPSSNAVSGSVEHTTTTTTTTTQYVPTPPPTPLAPPTPSPAVTGPVQVYVMMGQSNMLGEGKVAGWKDGTLQYATGIKGLYPYLVDEQTGDWSQIDHVRDVAVMGGGGADGTIGSLHHNEWVSVNPTKKSTIGPELGIGFAMGLNGSQDPTMLLKSCIGNRALGWDLLPPGTAQWDYDYGNGKVSTFAGYGDSPSKWDKGTTPVPIGWHAGLQYDGDVNRTKLVLEDLATYYPGATSFEVAGFFWWQGDKDMRDPGYYTRYEFNLVNLIKALRIEFNAPNAKFVTATLGQTVKGSTSGDGQILDAMFAVANSTKYPEFAGNVAAVYTHPLQHGGGSSSSHYGGDAETYMNIGEAMGAAMNEMVKSDSISLI